MAEGSIDERAPLLDRVEAGESSPPPEKKRTWWTIGWYAVWTVLGVFVAAIFVKGFIDADDIEVSIYCLILGASGLVQRRRRNGQRHTSGNRVVIRALCMVLDGTLDPWNPPLL